MLAIFLLFALSGMVNGAIRRLSGIISLVISCFLVSFLLPYSVNLLKQQTPVYDGIVSQCDRVIDQIAAKAMPQESQPAIDKEQLRQLLEWSDMDGSQVDRLSYDDLIELAGRYFPDYFPQLSETMKKALDNLGKNDQTRLILQLPLPDFMKNMMLTYNNSEGYRKLDTSDFRGYLVHFIANAILNVIAFLVTLAVVHLIVLLLLKALDMIAHFPILNTFNRLGGLIIGGIEGILAIWLIFLIISMLSGTRIGITLLGMINESPLLKPLYNNNLFMVIAVNAIKGIL